MTITHNTVERDFTVVNGPEGTFKVDAFTCSLDISSHEIPITAQDSTPLTLTTFNGPIFEDSLDNLGPYHRIQRRE